MQINPLFKSFLEKPDHSVLNAFPDIKNFLDFLDGLDSTGWNDPQFEKVILEEEDFDEVIDLFERYKPTMKNLHLKYREIKSNYLSNKEDCRFDNVEGFYKNVYNELTSHKRSGNKDVQTIKSWYEKKELIFNTGSHEMDLKGCHKSGVTLLETSLRYLYIFRKSWEEYSKYFDVELEKRILENIEEKITNKEVKNVT